MHWSRRCFRACAALIAAVVLCANSHCLALAPGALDSEAMDRMRRSGEIEQDLAAVAQAVDAKQWPADSTVGRLQNNFQELYGDPGVRVVFFIGHPGLVFYVPAGYQQTCKVIDYRVLDQKGEILPSSLAPADLMRLFSGRVAERSRRYKRYVVATHILDSPDEGKVGDTYFSVEPGALNLKVLKGSHWVLGDGEVKYLLGKADEPLYRGVAMSVLAGSNRREAIEKMMDIFEMAQGRTILGMPDAESIQFLKEYFDEKNWTIYRNQLVAMAGEVAPRLFQVFAPHYERFAVDEQLAGYWWVLAMLDLLPGDFPAPRFFLNEVVLMEVNKFNGEFPEVLASMVQADPLDLIGEFRDKMKFLSLLQAIGVVGIANARDVGLAFHERKGIVVVGHGGVEEIIFPEGLSFREFEEAFWHNWVGFLSAKGAYGNILELPEVMGRLAFQGRNNYPLKYRIMEDFLMKGWDEETMEIIHAARRSFDHLPAMQRVAKEFPRRYFYLKWLLGERFFRGLYGVYLVHLIYEITVHYPDNAQLTFELSKEFARRLMAGVPPARAYDEAFATEFAREKIFRKDIFVSAEARRLALEEEAQCASAL